MSDARPLPGFGLPVSGSWARPATMIRVARRAEELGYASLCTFQRVLAPAAGELDPDDLADRLAGTVPQYADKPFHRVLVGRIVTITGWAASDDA